MKAFSLSLPIDLLKGTVVVLLFLMSPPSGSAQKVEAIDVNDIHARAVVAEERGNYELAVELFRQAFLLEPSQPIIRANYHIALKNYSIDLAEKGQAQAAIEACSEALTLFPRDVTVASNLAIFFHKRAVDPLNDLRLASTVEAAQYSQGNEAIFLEAHAAIDTAEEVVEKFRLIRLAPTVSKTHAEIYLLEGRYSFLKEDSSRALQKFEECLRINPQEARAYLDRSRVYYERKYYDDAISDLEEAARILGDPSGEIGRLVLRLSSEAQASGVVLTGSSDFFEVVIVGGDLDQERSIKQKLKQLRREIGLILANPNGQMEVTVDWTVPLVRVGDWLGTPIEKKPVSTGFRLGANGVNLESPDFDRALRFHYILTLALDLSHGEAPFWFVSGLAQSLVEDTDRLSDEDQEVLAAATENALLLGIGALSWENIGGLKDSQLLRMANLESKALVTELRKAIQTRGLGQIMQAMKGGVGFEQAMVDVTRMTPSELEEEMRQSLGF